MPYMSFLKNLNIKNNTFLKIKIKFKIKNKTKTIPVYALHIILCINNFVPVQTQEEILFTESPSIVFLSTWGLPWRSPVVSS